MINTEALKTEANTLGFCLAGIADLSSDLYYDRFKTWIANGLHAGQQYLSRQDTMAKRQQPNLLLEGANAALVLAARYPLHAVCPSGTGRISSYACGEDYHHTLAKAAEALMQRLISLGQYQGEYRTCVDSSAVLERSLAVQASLGWIGKNGMLIHPQYGSALLLCEILLQLTYQPPTAARIPDRCGTCQRCITACPTGCILPDRTIDSRRCLSYQTIENKGQISPEIIPVMSGNLFGCDICQLACPWNKLSAEAAGDTAFMSKPDMQCVDFHAELHTTPAQFALRFQDTPVLRAKYAGWMRNVRALTCSCAAPSSS